MPALLEYPLFHATDDDHLPLAGGKLFTYLPGTSTPTPVYTNALLTIPHPNPVILDAAGEALIYFGVPLKATVTDAAGVAQWTIDPVLAPTTDPAMLDDISPTVLAYQTQTDPGELGSENLPASLAGELERLRYAVFDAKRGLDPTITSWYETPAALGLVNVKAYGAQGNGVTDDTAAIQAAVDSLGTSGGTVYIPRGVYALTASIRCFVNDVLFQGDGWSSVLKMLSGGALNPTLGCLTFGLTMSTTEVPIRGGGARDLQLDGNDLCKPLYVRETSLATFRRLLCTRSSRALAHFRECHSVTLEDCYLTDSNAPDQYGDGVYMEACTDMRILSNHIYDFKRIGICSEEGGDSGTINSSNPLIAFNHIQYAHDATATEHNSGIWCENTNGARILGNYIYDLYNTPGANNVQGITVWGGQDTLCTFQIAYNVIRRVYTGSGAPAGVGIHISTSPIYTNCLISANQVTEGYTYGLYIDGGKDMHIEGNYFGDATFTGSTGCIFITTSTAALGHVYVGPNRIGTMTYTSVNAAALKFYQATKGIAALTIQGLIDWKINFEDRPSVVSLTNCVLTQDGNTATAFGLGATVRLELHNVTLTDTFAGAGSQGGIRSASACVIVAHNCQFIGVWLQAATTATLMASYYRNCYFTNQARFTAHGNGTLTLSDCLIDNYPLAGFLRGSDTTGTLNIYVQDCRITHTEDYTTFVKTTNDADNFAVVSSLKGSAITTLATFTPSLTGFALVTLP